MTTRLPIDDALPALVTALRSAGRAVLQAPPGAGKTTRVPLAILDASLCKGRILMLEPRRLAARAAAERMAQTLGQDVGQTVGYRIRGESKVGKSTRVEVVTEGILTRMLQTDPSLDGIGAVIFDEFHERSLNADLGLALTWEVREALRDDLLIVVMSATLDAEPVARMLDDAPVITSQGRSYPVQTIWLDKPVPKTQRLPDAARDLVQHAVSQTQGGVLVFLPGEGEIRRVAGMLNLPDDCHIHMLFGAMDFKAQRAAISPTKQGRKIVLATAIAETSLTIQDIRVVVDCGYARRARFDPASGMSRLITERVTKAEAIQRQGRAGRVAEGVCYRLWTKGAQGAMQAFPPAEIEVADLTGLVLELALWGTTDPAGLSFLTQPSIGAYGEAVTLLQGLGALDIAGKITPHGRALSALPLHPRLAHMLEISGSGAAEFAALLAERDPLRGAPVDLALRLEALRDPKQFARNRTYPVNIGVIMRIRSDAKRLRRGKPLARKMSLGEMAALAYPDRIALRRKGDDPRWVLSGGKGAVMRADDPLAGARLLVATDLDGNEREARIRQAVEISEADVRHVAGTKITWVDRCEWSKRERRVVARQQEMLGALTLQDRIWRDVTADKVAHAMLDGVRELGLPFSPAARRFQVRVLLMDGKNGLPEFSDTALMARIECWLLPTLNGVKTAEALKKLDLLEPLRQSLTWDQLQQLDHVVPAHFTTPMGNKTPIDYSGDHPQIILRLQEMFGTTRHPTVGPNRTPLRVTLLSPARRPVQTTMDIPGFWASSYADVRKDMRAKYPRHPWPEDPTDAKPTLRAKPRWK